MSDYVYRNVSVRHFTCDVIARDGSLCERALSCCSQSIVCAEHAHGGRQLARTQRRGAIGRTLDRRPAPCGAAAARAPRTVTEFQFRTRARRADGRLFLTGSPRGSAAPSPLVAAASFPATKKPSRNSPPRARGRTGRFSSPASCGCGRVGGHLLPPYENRRKCARSSRGVYRRRSVFWRDLPPYRNLRALAPSSTRGFPHGAVPRTNPP